MATIKMEKWVEECKLKVRLLKNTHDLQRIQMELALETAPRDSRYSNALIDMMKKEEHIVANDPPLLSHTTKSIINKVDDVLKSETRAFFAKLVQKNIKKWNSWREKIDSESRQLKKEIFDTLQVSEAKAAQNLSKSAHRNAHSKDSVPRLPTAEELEAESLRLEIDYNRNWYRYESFNLLEAFKSQSNKIDNDWGTHERNLEEDYLQKKYRVEGPSIGAGAGGAGAYMSPTQQQQQQQDPRWQHPEKQKTLIHTAPVLTPTRVNTSLDGFSPSNNWAKAKDHAAINAEVRFYLVLCFH